MIRKALLNDIGAVSAIYEKIHAEESAGRACIGWQAGVYPVRATAEAALGRDDLFVYEEDGRVLASGIINRKQVDVYADGSWLYEADDSEVMVLHTLTVDPAEASRGIGAAIVSYYEEYARENGCTVLRIDTNEKNAVARRFYKKLGYREAGCVPCVFNGIEGVMLVLLEKKL